MVTDVNYTSAAKDYEGEGYSLAWAKGMRLSGKLVQAAIEYRSDEYPTIKLLFNEEHGWSLSNSSGSGMESGDVKLFAEQLDLASKFLSKLEDLS